MNARQMAQLLNSSAEPRVWTCPLCNLRISEFQGNKCRKLSDRRTKHLDAKHPGVDKRTVYGIRIRAEHVDASFDIPPEAQGWKCPFCEAALPLGLSKYVVEQARTRHFQKAHPKRKITMATVHAARAKQYKKNPDQYPAQSSKAKAVSEKLARTLEDPHLGGHDLRVIRPCWSDWPTTSKKLRAGTLITCVSCWRASNDDWEKPCVGKYGKRRSPQRALWKRLVENPENANIQILLNTWGTTLQEVNQVMFPQGDSTLGGYSGQRVGEASNPGPASKKSRTKQLTHLSFASLNVQCEAGCWRALRELAPHHDVIALQETHFTEAAWQAFSKTATKEGFAAYHLAGQLAADKRPRGGVCFLIKKHVPHRFGESLSEGDTQAICVWIRGIAVCGFYSPPKHEDELCELFMKLYVRNEFHCHHWLGMGDFNQAPENSPFANTVLNAGGQCISDLAPTRWESRACVDWYFSSRLPFSWNGLGTEALSDHIPIQGRLELTEVLEKTKGRLKRGPVWLKPDEIETEEWTKVLDDAWDQLKNTSETVQALHFALEQVVPDVETEWDLFCRSLDNTFRHVFQQYQQISQQPEVSAACDKALRSAGSGFVKGGPAVHQWVSVPVRTAGKHESSERLRRLSKRLARLYELRKCLLDNNHGKRETVIHRLFWNVWREKPPRDFSTRWTKCQDDIVSTKANQLTEEKAQRDQRLKHWKHSIRNPNLGGLSRWIKGKEKDHRSVTLRSQGRVAETRQAAIHMIRDHWQQVWRNQGTFTPGTDQIAQTLVEAFPVQLRNRQVQWTVPQEGHLIKAFANATGTAGPDGWSAAEIRHLPQSIVKIFHRISLRWLTASTVPAALRQAIQFNLPKETKIQDHALDGEHTRPISVQSIWWRVFAKSWLDMPSCKEWCTHFIHEDVLCQVNALGAEDAAAYLHDVWRTKRQGELCSLDWSKAFDHTHPDAVRQTLVALGWPPGFCAILQQVQQHDRWLAWDGEIGQSPMHVDSAIPQGCPISPLLLAVVTSAGAYRTSGNPNIVQKIYMDDRTFWGKTDEDIQQQVKDWQAFSQQIGFIENEAKKQVTSEGHEIKFLGITTVRKPRANLPDEEKRLQRALLRADLLRHTGLALDQVIRAGAALVTSVAAYGWIGRLPTKRDGKKPFAALTKHGACKAASPFIRNVLYGCTTNLEAVVAQRTIARAHRLQRRGMLRRSVYAGTTWHLLTRCLNNCGWKLRRRTMVFDNRDLVQEGYHADVRTINLNCPDGLAAQKHVYRHSWRRKKFQEWLGSSRHEAAQLLSNYDSEDLLKRFHQFDWKFTREAIGLGPTFRSVLLGSAVSDSWLAGKRGEDPLQAECCLCGNPPGHLQHLFWHCHVTKDSRQQLAIAEPEDPLKARFGWLREKGDTAELTHMANCVQMLWDMRYGSNHAAPPGPAPVHGRGPGS
eukprot:s742_g16.t1